MNPAFCPKCQRSTVTLFEDRGHFNKVHNVCAVCKTHRPGIPFVTRSVAMANTPKDSEVSQRLAREVLP